MEALADRPRDIRAGVVRVAAVGARHWVFLLFVAAGAALRGVAFLAYRPALFSPDTIPYLQAAEGFTLPAIHPIGYSAFLRVMFAVYDDYAIVPLVQHILGVAVAVLLYATLLRLGARRWLAGVACAPVLLDSYQLNIEQYVLSDTLFELFVVAACALLLWRRPLGLAPAALAGLLLAAATLTRGIGVLSVVPAGLAVLFLHGRPSRALALAGAFAVPVGAYVLAFHAASGTYSLTGYEGRFLYGRVVQWADCDQFSPPAYERPLCSKRAGRDLPWVYEFMWSRKSPLYRVDPPPGMTLTEVAGDFAKRAIAHQPLTYARVVASDFLLSFAPTKEGKPGVFRASQWHFQLSFPIPGQQRGWTVTPPRGFAHGEPGGHVDRSLASFLRTYQRFGYTPGPLLAAGLLVGLATALGLGRTRHSGLRSASFLFVGLTVALCLGSIATTMFSWRYQLPQLVLLPPAFALGLTALTAKAPRSAAGSTEAEVRAQGLRAT
jgi:hypothetical protein